MKFFENRVVERKEIAQPNVDNADFIKRNLMKSVDRSKEVRAAVEKWLFTFDGAMTKKVFEHQMKRLDFDDTKALAQLALAVGRRTIPLPKEPRPPKLEQSIVAQMVQDTYVAVTGRRFKALVKEAVKELRPYGSLVVLSMEELIVEFKGYYEKGRGPKMIEDAIEADFLIVVDLEMPIHLEWHIREAIERIGRMREKNKKPIISTWNRYNDCNEFFKRFKIYE